MHRMGGLVVAAAIGACGDSRSAPTDAAVDSPRVDGAVVDAVADAAIDASPDAATTPTEEARLVGSITGTDAFGCSVALSDDASRALIGAVADNSARVFVRTGTTWTQEASLVALVPGPNDYFGNAVALSADGSLAVVGAPNDNTPSGASAGSARVYLRTGTAWVEQTILRPTQGGPYDYAGTAVALSSDGTRAIVGVPYDDTTGDSVGEGSARVFLRTGTTWVEEAALFAAGAEQLDRFGTAVALSSDGSRALVGAPTDDTANGGDAGTARVFVRSGTTWVEEAELVGADGVAGDHFGVSVALSADGSRAIVGTEYGKPRVFLRTGTTWVEEAAFVHPDQLFGKSVALNADASRALVGAPLAQAGSVLAGTVHVFERSGTTWAETARLAGVGAGGLSYFGQSVALTADGSRGLVGADGDNTTGSARVILFP